MKTQHQLLKRGAGLIAMLSVALWQLPTAAMPQPTWDQASATPR